MTRMYCEKRSWRELVNILSGEEIAVVAAVIYGITPFLVSIVKQLPKKMIAEYKNECREFLELKSEREKVNNLLDIKESRYNKIKTPLSIFFFLPVISYFFAKTKLEEEELKYENILLLELAIILIGLTTFIHYGLGIIGMSRFLFYESLVMIAFIDADTKLIPDTISIPLLWLGLLLAILEANGITAENAIIGAFFGYSGPWLISKAVCYRVDRPDGMGYGDFKMLAMLGAWLGPMGTLNTTILSSIIFLIYFTAMRLANKVTSESLIPFGPFLSIAAYCVCQSPIFHFSRYLGIASL